MNNWIMIGIADGSYTPSLFIVSAADSLSGMKEVAAVSVGLQVRFLFFNHQIRMNYIFKIYIYLKEMIKVGLLKNGFFQLNLPKNSNLFIF